MADLNDYIDYLYSRLGNMYVLGGQGGRFVDALPVICKREEQKIGLVPTEAVESNPEIERWEQ